MLVAAGHVVAALVAAVALVVKLWALRRNPGNPKTLASVGICLGCGIAVTAGWAPVHSLIDRVSGVPNLAKPIEHGSALLAATAIQFLFLHLGNPQRARRLMRLRLVFFGVVLAVMVAMFWAAAIPESEPLHFAERYGSMWQISAYMLAFLLYLGVSVVDVLRMSLGYARYAGARLKIIMRLLSAGALFGAAFVAHKALFLALKLGGVAPPWPEPIVTQTLVTMSVVLICSSLVLATVWKTVDGVRAWPRRSAVYRDLHALWYLLYRAVPDIVLDPPRRPKRNSWWVVGVGQRLYRRCVEIGDGLQVLGPPDARVAAAAQRRASEAGWGDARAAAAGEAAAILVAVRRREHRRVPVEEVDPGLEPQPAKVAHVDVEADARRLALISMVLSEELVCETAAEFSGESASEGVSLGLWCSERGDAGGITPLPQS
ncbi:MAB_1171c family putative transporter [Micromonospora sp. NPDC006766]|uniref:MAB_1171c family putative transporter n=1 Tax=Micromonospora sp. NPDC006766 TaxID=3154778 RepID=UPI0033EFA066